MKDGSHEARHVSGPARTRRRGSPASPGDHVASLVFEAAPQAYIAVAGSEPRARAAIEQLWRVRGHSASFEHAIVAELDGRLAGVLIGFPARDRYRLHLALLRKGLRYVNVRRWPLLLAALPQLIAATPRPPRRAYYVGTIAVAPTPADVTSRPHSATTPNCLRSKVDSRSSSPTPARVTAWQDGHSNATAYGPRRIAAGDLCCMSRGLACQS